MWPIARNLSLAAAFALCACSNDTNKVADASASTDGGDAGVARPNVVFILTDDLSWNLVQYMPAVQQLQRDGLTFTHYFVTDSLCCPSRSSIFTGKYPHNTHVWSNSGDAGGYHEFQKRGNATETFASVLQPAGYKTGMMGKYLNGYQPAKDQSDPGWMGWDVVGEGGYGEYNYDVNQNGSVMRYGDMGSDYLTDVLSGMATTFIQGAGQGPFLLEVATFAPHAPYTPAPRYVGKFNVTIPRMPPFDTAVTNPPQWLAQHQPLTSAEMAGLDTGYNLRVESVQAVDDLITGVRQLLAQNGLDKNTYLIFSSDNGYHMGDHMLLEGKETAFDHDIRVPLVVVGPGVPAGASVDLIAENIDLCSTFADIAGTAPPTTTDGRSLLPVFQGQMPTDWRNVALIEHHGPDLATSDATDPDTMGTDIRPNSYEALRMAESVYVLYQDGETEFYDHASDPNELDNTASTLPAATVQKYQATISAIQNCQGSDACWAAQHM